MDWPVDRRTGPGRRGTDQVRPFGADQDVLHDIGHELATLALLAESVLGGPGLSEEARTRVALIESQVARLVDLVRGTPVTTPVDVRALLGQVVAVAAAAGAPVGLAPGEPVTADLDPAVLWRVVSNLVANAVRAGGEVTVAVVGTEPLVVEVVDTGPGFGAGPPGRSGRGLGIVDALARSVGGVVRITPRLPTGTRIRVAFGVVEPTDGTPEAT
ncbi:sensor histidine kinase [Actinokineospora terrae]|uniref:histidine kinase n=1 Tax=Actinokineospora terrae TaxID=155974 RepID=A0A1H9QBK0_9PSEU|nr:ATP-binding protein [Actinokineospora terrae]SER57810.1 Histidine kinase-, DNA gyrase B-, and HSP90-like ATPase [Actinokineospora terrae]